MATAVRSTMLLLTVLAGACKRTPPAAPPPVPAMRGEGWDGYATQERCAAPGVHVELHILVEALGIWMTADEAPTLDAIDLSGTRAGDEAISWSLTDGVVRSLVPLHLDALGRGPEATALRGLPPVHDPATGDAALQALVRIDAVTAEDSWPTLELDVLLSDLERLNLREPTAPWRGPDDDEHCYELGEALSTVSAAAEAAIEAGAPRDAVVSACLSLVERTARAAR